MSSSNSKPKNTQQQQQHNQPKQQHQSSKHQQQHHKKGWNTKTGNPSSNGGSTLSANTNISGAGPSVRNALGGTGATSTSSTAASTSGAAAATSSGGATRNVTPKQITVTGGNIPSNNYAAVLKQASSAAASSAVASSSNNTTTSGSTGGSVVKSTPSANGGSSASKPTAPPSVWGAPLPPGIIGTSSSAPVNPAPKPQQQPPTTTATTTTTTTTTAAAAESSTPLPTTSNSSVSAVASAGQQPGAPASNLKKVEKPWQNPEAAVINTHPPVASTTTSDHMAGTNKPISTTLPIGNAPPPSSSLAAAVIQQQLPQEPPPPRPSPTPGNVSPMIASSSPTPNMQQYPFTNVQQQQQQMPFMQRPPPTWQQAGQPYHPQQPPQINPYYAQHMMHPQQPHINPYAPPPGASNTHAQYSYHMGGMVPPQQQQQPPQYHHHMMPFPAGGLMRPVTALPKQPQVPTPPTSGNIAGAFVPTSAVPAAPVPPPRKKKISVITDKQGNPIDLTKPSSLATAVAASKSTTVTTDVAVTTTSEAPVPNVTVEPTASTQPKQQQQQLQQQQQSEQEKTKQSEDAGAKLRAAAEMAIKSDRKAEEEKAARIEAEKRETEEREEKERLQRLEEEEKIRKLKEEEEEKERIQKAMERAEEEEEAARKRRAASLSAMQAKLELKKQEAKQEAKAVEITTAEQTVVTLPVVTPAAPSLRPTSGSLRPGGLRPSRGSSPTPVAAAPVITTGLRPGGGNRMAILDTPTAVTPTFGTKRMVYSKEEMLSFKDCPACIVRPSDLPELSIVSTTSGQSSRGGGGGGVDRSGSISRGPTVPGGGNQWSRVSQQQPQGGPVGGGMRRQSSGGSESWSRGKELPQPPPERPGRGGGRGAGRGGRGGRQDQYDDRYDQGPPLFDGPVKPIERTLNRWRPTKDTSVFIATEKKVKGILNKMTKTNYERLSQQICDITIPSYEVLSMIINRVFEKAIDEPSFGDTYADLCVRLSKNVNPDSFVHIIEERKKESPVVYRWSSNIGTSDSEIFGPFGSEEECIDVAFLEDSEAPKPIKRGERELILVKPMIVEGMFLKIMQIQQVQEAGEEAEPVPKMFVVFFPVEDIDNCGQQLSDPFETDEECRKDSRKWNSSKRSLLNKCEEEFKKQDIYVDWKKEKKEYEAMKESMTEAERNETEEALEMKRIKIKKQMLGNIRFIGELFKKRLIKEKIMHECIQSLMKLKKTLDGGLEQAQDDEMDEEDHEALCQLFNTIGEEIDRSSKHGPMELYFDRIEVLSNDKSLNSRSRFMYKDLIELRQNGWQTRRKQETAKTLDEIRKDAAREEYLAQQQQQQVRDSFRPPERRDTSNRSGYADPRINDPRRSITGQSVARGQQFVRQTQPTPESSKKFSQSKSATQADGYTQILARKPSTTSFKSPSSEPELPRPGPLNEDELKKRIAGIRKDYLNNPTDEAELLASVEELSGTESYQKTLTLSNCEWSLECKPQERLVVIKMLLILLKRQKILPSHFEAAFAELIEFLEDMKIDIPKVYENIGELLGAILIANGLDLSWLCRECSKIPNEESRAKLIQQIMKEIEKTNGRSAVVSCFSPHEGALVTLLGQGKWGSIKSY